MPVAGLLKIDDVPADSAGEVERLRMLLDRQPSCLMRVARDGTLLAVNDAAQSLLGTTLPGALGKMLPDWLAGDAAGLWREFAERVRAGGSASLECEMRDPSGTLRVVMLRAVSLPSHPDGIESLLVTARDVSVPRRLQDALHEQETRLQAQIAEVTRERDALRATLATERTDREQLQRTVTQLRGSLGTALESALLAQTLIEKGGPV